MGKAELRQSFQDLMFEGILKEKKLEFVKDDEQENIVKGEIIAITGDKQEHKIRIYAKEKTKEGKDNPSYTGLKTVDKEYVSMVEAKEDSSKTPDKIRFNPTLSLNEYFRDTGEHVNFPSLSTNFINRVKDEFNPRATGTIECFINKIRDEIEKGEPTGRKLVDVFIVNFDGTISPLTFVVNEDLTDAFDRIFEAGKNAIFNVNFINTATEVKITRGSGFGQTVDKTYTTYKQEIVIIGGEDSQYDEDENSPIKLKIGKEEKVQKGYAKDDIKAAMKQREITLDEMRSKAMSGGSKSSGKSSASSTPKENYKDW